MLFRMLVTTKLTVSHTFVVDGVATDAAGAVTGTVKRLDGTAVGAPITATSAGAGSGKYSLELPNSAVLDAWSLDWAGTVAGSAVVIRDYVEHVGGFLFDIGAARAAHRSTANPWNTARYSDDLLVAKRTAVEQEAEAIAHTAFVPRFARFVLSGSGTDSLVTPDMDLRAVRSVKIADAYGQPYVALGSAELAAVAPLDSGVLARDDGSTWPVGRRNVIIEYEHGLDYPPGEVTDAAIMRLRYMVSSTKTSIPDRAISYSDPGRFGEGQMIYGGGIIFDQTGEGDLVDGDDTLVREVAVIGLHIRVEMPPGPDGDDPIEVTDEIAETMGDALAQLLAEEPHLAGGMSISRIVGGQCDHYQTDTSAVSVLTLRVSVESDI